MNRTKQNINDKAGPALRARDFFSRQGVLSQWHPQYEFRPSQLAMAEEVEASLLERRHLVVEAGTGTGKTLAYLVPVVLSGKRVIISTGTKNLQEQLYHKDLPFLQKLLGRPLRVAYMKGRKNYLCRQKIYDAEDNPIFDGPAEVEEFRAIYDWEKQTTSGDRAELKMMSEDSKLWFRLDARRELCSGQKCEQFERCFITHMHQQAAEADIIIVNHHLFFADLSLREGDYASIIPDYQAVVFDEAHEIEEVAGQHFGIQISNYRFNEIVRDVRATALRKTFGSKSLDRALQALSGRSETFFALLAGQEGRSSFRDRAKFADEHGSEYAKLLNALELVDTQLKGLNSQVDEMIPLERRIAELAEGLRFVMEGNNEKFVYWLETRGRGVFLQATPIDVSEILKERLFNEVAIVVLTSATLAVEGKFDYIRDRLGVDLARELVVPPYFDFQTQALFYVPPLLPDPRSAQFVKAASDEIIRLLRSSGGYAFVLFTSHQQMHAVYDFVSFAVEYPILLQGSAPNRLLLDQFRNTPHCVLFATASFWQGVDVPGEQLRSVIIDKLPFAAPSDPVVAARINNLRCVGQDPFLEYQIPQAVISLKQGFGRLIRNRQDRGLLALLDNRILRRPYGKIFYESLPSYRFTTSIEDVKNFFVE